jgi:RNA 3'-terminal phosphate cyclase (ATP)
MLIVDASEGEGGGQIVRTALALAAALGRAVALRRMRERRPKPGLRPQHVTVARALRAIADADLSGDAVDSRELTFIPRALCAGEHRFDIGEIRGSAGSVSLALEALLLPLAMAPAQSTVTVLGGTHVPWSPPVHYLVDVFLPALRDAGIDADVALRRWGWYPAGGGEVHAVIRPSGGWNGIDWHGGRPGAAIRGISAVSRLPISIALRQRTRALARLRDRGLDADIALHVDDSA